MSGGQKKNFKRTLFLALVLMVITVSISITGTIAYFTHTDFDTNTLKVGFNEIEITEQFDPPEVLEQGENKYKKNVAVTNTGNVDCYVRVFLEFSEGDIRDISSFSSDGSTFYPADEYLEHLPAGWVYISRDVDPVLGDYYYYKDPLKPGETTKSLIDSVKTIFATAEDVRDYEIIVYSESIQTLDMNGESFSGENAWKAAWDEFIDYEYEEPLVYHTVTFEAEGGTLTPDNGSTPEETYSVQVLHGDTVSQPSDDPEKGDSTFLGWYNNDGTALFDFDTPIVTDTIIRAKWEDPIKHTVIFTSTGYPFTPADTSVEVTYYEVEVLDGATVSAPNVEPEYTNAEGDILVFGSWHTTAGTTYDFNTPVTSDITLTLHVSTIHSGMGEDDL